VYHEDVYEKDLQNEKYKVRLRDFKYEDPSTYLPAAICRQPFSRIEKEW